MAGFDDMEWPPRAWVTPPEQAAPYGAPPEPEADDWRSHFAPVAEEPQDATWPPPHWQTAQPGPSAEELAQLASVPPDATGAPAPTLEQVQQAGEAGDTGVVPFPPPEWVQPERAIEQAPPADDVVEIAPTAGTELERVSDLSDEELAEEQAIAETQREQDAARKRVEAAEYAQDMIALNMADRKQAAAQTQAKLDQLDQEWQAHGQQKIDTGRWWRNRSTGEKAMAYIGAGIHGFLNPGGSNQTIEAVKDAIGRDLEAQRIDLETGRTALNARRGLVADYARITGDLQQAQDAAMVATLGALENQIAAEAAAYDPAGTAARRADAMRRQVEAARAQAQAKLEAQAMEQAIKAMEADRKERELAQRQREHIDDVTTARKQIGLGYSRLGFDKAKHKDDVQLKLAELEGQREERQAKLKETSDKDTRERGVWQVKAADGSVWKAPTPDAAKDVNNTIGAAQKITDITNRIIELRRANPHEWAKINTDAKNEMRSLHGSLLFEVKNAAELGVLSKDDRELVENVIGDDPTGLFSNIKKLETYRNLAIDNANTKIRHQYGYQGKAWRPEVVQESEAPLTENEKSEVLLNLEADKDLENQESKVGTFALESVGIPGIKLRKSDVDPILGTAAGTQAASERVRGDTFDLQKEELRKVRTRAMDLGDRTKALDALVRSGAKKDAIKAAEAAVAESAEAVDMLRRIRQQNTPVGKWAAQITKGMFEGPAEEGDE